MKRSLVRTAWVGAIVSLVLGARALALPMMNGVISFDGNATLDSADLATATQAVAFSPFTVGTASGSFAVVPIGTAVNTAVSAGNPWMFVSGPYSGLWSVSVGADNFNYDLTASVITFQGAGGIIVNGWGWVSDPGVYDPTPGTWSFSTQPGAVGPATFRFSATTVAPDGGATALLLGLGLTGVALIARMRKLV